MLLLELEAPLQEWVRTGTIADEPTRQLMHRYVTQAQQQLGLDTIPEDEFVRRAETVVSARKYTANSN